MAGKNLIKICYYFICIRFPLETLPTKAWLNDKYDTKSNNNNNNNNNNDNNNKIFDNNSNESYDCNYVLIMNVFFPKY